MRLTLKLQTAITAIALVLCAVAYATHSYETLLLAISVTTLVVLVIAGMEVAR